MLRKYLLPADLSKLLNIQKLSQAAQSLRRVAAFEQRPILIGGCGRTGTSLLSAVLDVHPLIYCYPKETDLFHKRRRYRSASLNHARNILLFYSLLAREEIPQSAARWCEKTPKNVRCLDEVFDEFNNNVDVLLMIRDGRDVVTSVHPSRPGYYVSPERWIRDTRLTVQYADRENVLVIPYERLVEDFDATMAKIVGHLGIPMSAQFKDFAEHTAIRNHGAWHDGVRPLHKKSVARWTQSEHQERVTEFMSIPEVPGLLEDVRRISESF